MSDTLHNFIYFKWRLITIAQYLDIIQSLKTLITARGKKPYLLAVGKPSPAKLGNFLEIDVFCIVSCPENSLLDTREFMRPVVTPYEMLIALDPETTWNPSHYELDLSDLAPKFMDGIQRQKGREVLDEEPHFSLVTGGYAINKFSSLSNLDPNSSSSAELVKKGDGSLATYVSDSASANYLQTRSFKGLETDLGSKVAELEIGRKGIAKGYSHEKV